MRLALLALVACGGPEPAPVPGGAGVEEDVDTAVEVEAAPVVVDLPAPRLLRRISLDLRGVLPTVDELDAVEADPAQVDAYAAAWLDDPRLEARLMHVLAERWHTRIDEYLVRYLEYPEVADEPANELRWERSVGEEPLRLMAHIVVEDRPWTEVVTADYTVANGILAAIWDLDHPGGDAWDEARYTDGRPAAGVLATNGLWFRYFSTTSNYNRGRVAAITRLLICEDYAARTITFTEADGLASGDDIEDALRGSPYCMGCHAAIDPIAATLFGFWPANEYQTDEIDTYHPEREALGPDLLGVSPAWYGDPVYGLNELGAHIAADPRFSRCAVQTFAEGLWRRALDPADDAEVERLRRSFEADDLRVKGLLAKLLATPTYRAGGLAAGASEADATRERPVRLLPPNVLSTMVADLTGYTMDVADRDALDDDTTGFRNLAGGVDGEAVTRPQDTPGLTRELVVQRLAEGAAARVVARELVEGGGGDLLAGVTLQSVPPDAAFQDALAALHWRLYGRRATDDEVADLLALWQVVAAQSDAAGAWRAVLTALFRDPAFGSA